MFIYETKEEKKQKKARPTPVAGDTSPLRFSSRRAVLRRALMTSTGASRPALAQAPSLDPTIEVAKARFAAAAVFGSRVAGQWPPPP